MGTTQRGEFGRATGTVMLDSAEERGAARHRDRCALAQGQQRGDGEVRARPVDAEHRGASRDRLPGAAHRVFGGRPTRIEGELTLLGVTRSVALDVSSYDCTGAGRPALRDRRDGEREALGFRHDALQDVRERRSEAGDSGRRRQSIDAPQRARDFARDVVLDHELVVQTVDRRFRTRRHNRHRRAPVAPRRAECRPISARCRRARN